MRYGFAGRMVCAACAFAVLPGCAMLRSAERPASSPSPIGGGQGIIFVADGSADLREVSTKLAAVVKSSGAPLRVERVVWSHGKGQVFQDMYDGEYHKSKGRELAQQILAYRKAYPDQRICLVGYSSGAAITLSAAEALPPGTLDRMVLLSPSVAAKRDLRPVLLSCKEGVDNFRSDWDAICLMLTAMGTADGVGLQIAGRTGFAPVIESPQDKVLYQSLREHTWKGPANWAGHDGGHFGCFQPEFLQKQVLPCLLGR